MCLQETKLPAVSKALIRSLWRGRFVDWICLESVGASGGILLMWDNRVVERLEEAVGTLSISCKFQNVSSGSEWAFSGVYGPHRNAERRLLWEELSSICSWWDIPWCVGGDFNVVRYPSKRAGSDQMSPAMRDFSNFIFSLGLLDIPMEGGSMTWSNSISHSRLD